MQSNKANAASATGLMDLLLRSGEALQNWRALVTLIATAMATILVFGVLASSGTLVLMALGTLLAYLVASVGFSAAGILLMDQALGNAPRSISAALVDGIFAAVRLFVLGLIGLAIALAVILLTSLLLLVCKIPGLGGILYAVVLPAGALMVAFVYAALYFVFSLAGAAVWSGASIRQAVAALYAVIAHRLIEAALGVIVHSILMAIIGGIIVGFVVGGTGAVVALSAAILGNVAAPSLPLLMRGMGGMHGFSAMPADGLLYGGLLGFAVLVSLIGAALVAMLVLGLNRLYLHLTVNLDLQSAEEQVLKGLDKAKKQALEMQEAARQRAEAMRQRSQTRVQKAEADDTTSQTTAIPALLVCPRCKQPCAATDKYCENCGNEIA